MPALLPFSFARSKLAVAESPTMTKSDLSPEQVMMYVGAAGTVRINSIILFAALSLLRCTTCVVLIDVARLEALFARTFRMQH